MGRNKPVIAVVEDDALVRDSVGLAVEMQGWEVRLHASGESLLATLADDESIDALILDLHLPGLSGLCVQGHLRDRGASFPIIFLTATPNTWETEKAIAQGATALLRKPVSYEHLTQTLASALQPTA